jgi:hypothetical protein
MSTVPMRVLTENVKIIRAKANPTNKTNFTGPKPRSFSSNDPWGEERTSSAMVFFFLSFLVFLGLIPKHVLSVNLKSKKRVKDGKILPVAA